MDQIFFPGVIPYQEWGSGHSANLIAVAFADPEVAAALAGSEGWTARVEPVADDRWAVVILAAAAELAVAEVDARANAVVSLRVAP